MMEREPILPFVTGLVIAVAVHLAMVPGVRAWLVVGGDSDFRVEQPRPTPKELTPLQRQQQQQQMQRPNEPQIGQLEPSTETKVNLITYEDYRQLKAQQSEVDQPAVQQATEPDPMARQAPLDPTAAAAVSRPMSQPVAAMPSRPSPAMQGVAAQQQPQQQSEQSAKAEESEEVERQRQPAPPAAAPRSPGFAEDNAEEPDVLRVRSELDVRTAGSVAMDVTRPDEQSREDEADPAEEAMPRRPVQPVASMPSPASQAPPGTTAQPVEKPAATVAAKEDYESQPVSEIGYAEMSPGGVASVQGIKIKTVVPRYEVFATKTLPRNPRFEIHFNPEGKVIHVNMLVSSGYDNVDGPIISALYKWTAEGKIGPEGLTIHELNVLLGVNEDDEG